MLRQQSIAHVYLGKHAWPVMARVAQPSAVQRQQTFGRGISATVLNHVLAPTGQIASPSLQPAAAATEARRDARHVVGSRLSSQRPIETCVRASSVTPPVPPQQPMAHTVGTGTGWASAKDCRKPSCARAFTKEAKCWACSLSPAGTARRWSMPSTSAQAGRAATASCVLGGTRTTGHSGAWTSCSSCPPLLLTTPRSPSIGRAVLSCRSSGACCSRIAEHQPLATQKQNLRPRPRRTCSQRTNRPEDAVAALPGWGTQ